jgi:predicted DNA-binding WGR domain protein
MTLNYKWIGWCNEDGHDKVWGVIYLEKPTNLYGWSDAKCVSFWGRRGKKLQTKMVVDNWELEKLVNSKERKGYHRVETKKLDEVYPEFEQDLSKTAFWAMFKV